MLRFFQAASLAAYVSLVLPAFSATLTVKQDGTGDHATLQAAINAAAEGDIIIVSDGTYVEDISVGDFNFPSVIKNDLTIMAENAGQVTITAANQVSRMGGLAAAGNDAGPIDYFGFMINGGNITLDGLVIQQPAADNNLLGINAALAIGGPDVTIRNCTIEGPGLEVEGDVLGAVVVSLDVASLLNGTPVIATNTLIENCQFIDNKFAFAAADFIGVGVKPVVTINNCDFIRSDTGVELDDGIITVSNSTFRDGLRGIHISDDEATITNCIIENNSEHGFEIDAQDSEDDDPLDVPKVVIDNCIVRNNGTEEGHYGINMELGNLTLTNSVIAGSSGYNIFFEGEAGRETRVSVDHSDIYRSGIGTAVFAQEAAGDIITFTIKNSNVVDETGIVNNTIGLGDFTVEFCNVFTTGEQFTGEFLATTDISNVDPLYVDAENGDFTLQSGSPVLSAGEGGTYIGSQSAITSTVETWMMQ